MSTSEKHEPQPDAHSQTMSWSEVFLKFISVLALATYRTALGVASTTRIASEDSLLESAVKLLQAIGAAILIQAVMLHASLSFLALAWIWNLGCGITRACR